MQFVFGILVGICGCMLLGYFASKKAEKQKSTQATVKTVENENEEEKRND